MQPTNKEQTRSLIRVTVLAACLAYSSALKMIAVRPTETSAVFYQSTQHHIPEDSTLHDFNSVIPVLNYTVNQYAMKACGGCGDIAPPFLTSALDGGEWSASRP
jgi:hypothetical protein